MESLGRVGQQAVGTVSHKITVFLMASPHIHVQITSPGMITAVKIADLCQPWSWVLCERMKEDSIGQQDHDLCYKSARASQNCTGMKLRVPYMKYQSHQPQDQRPDGEGEHPLRNYHREARY